MIRANEQTERQKLHFKYTTAKKLVGVWDEYIPFHRRSASYIEDLKYVAAYQGYDPEVIAELLREGFRLWEVGEYLYA